ncbi:MAG: LD-carboxypeptidase [Eubacterium sp.]|nr:LD-carboxypeptidase [Eubacterium sp.]
MKKAGIVACSDAVKKEHKKYSDELVGFLRSIGITPLLSSCIYKKNGSIFSGTSKEKADQLMRMFSDPEMEEIYDISGGDMANELLDDLDYERIAASKAVLWGYSDLTAVLNAIYTMTGKKSVLYQVRFLTSFGGSGDIQRQRFQNREELFSPSFELVRGDSMRGVVVGGNIRCFLKLAGTRYFPELEGKLLLLEAHSGEVPQMITYLSQLRQLGAFDKVNGIILGTFMSMERGNCVPDITALVKKYIHPQTPVALTSEIGHGDDSKAIMIGKEIKISS